MNILWVPRLLAVAVILFLSVFALDAFSGGATLRNALADFVVHLTPSAILVGIVALSWRREWIGAVAFIGLAAAYAVGARANLSWIATISGPLLVVGVCYAWSWTRRKAVS